MNTPIVVSLVVSGIGMLMLFVALAVLYGLMVLMTRVTGTHPPVQDRPEPQKMGSERRQAAVIGVALARAEQDLRPTGATEARETASAWRALHHQRRLTRNTPTRRSP
jgi:hypothetical protein